MNQFGHFFFNSKVIYEASVTPNRCRALPQADGVSAWRWPLPSWCHVQSRLPCPNPPHISSHCPWALGDAQVFLVTGSCHPAAAAGSEQDCPPPLLPAQAHGPQRPPRPRRWKPVPSPTPGATPSAWNPARAQCGRDIGVALSLLSTSMGGQPPPKHLGCDLPSPSALCTGRPSELMVEPSEDGELWGPLCVLPTTGACDTPTPAASEKRLG